MAAPTFAQSRAALDGIPVNRGCRPVYEGSAPAVSIVVPTFNAANVLAVTLDSIAAQTWPHLDVVIADAGSRDGTVDVIQSHAGIISRWISAPDRGIADGFNRGITLTTGPVIQMIFADDRLGPDHISQAMASLQAHPAAGFAYGDVEMIDNAGQCTRIARGIPAFHEHSFDSMAVAPHPAVCVRRSTYEAVGLFDTDVRIVMDFDWLARCWHAGVYGTYSDRLCPQMTEGGFNNRHAIARDLENFRVTRHYRTMPIGPAAVRLALRLGMDVARLSLEAAGAQAASYAFRRWIDRRLGRARSAHSRGSLAPGPDAGDKGANAVKRR